ncbi:hypothetical protein ONS95_006814 [Cadophora gregata]|uniref:uncharacterized protein n=1 Tax=Cadophora gregata TaxID=51156 RepID=UPI0026DB188A|nr:uncharacterized protein ONS95_006814 [Cadophora gregata]KAK0101654.1 hypothetical protein ONS95_006814 [Cadophora gregata]KAK0106330.1 hypothetical protein ONS96_003966 [Cadophora gregata f. sp. sojae]
MPPKTKSKARAFKTISSSPKFSPSSCLEPPTPFKRAPATLEPFLSTLDTSHIYITHIDTKPKDFKQKIFLVPVLMNVVIIGLILWRIKTIGPFYMKICFSLMGNPNETTVDTTRMSFNDAFLVILNRAMIFIGDLLIYVFIWPWPREFFGGRTISNPVAWRFAVGFRPQEIIVRRSRKWDRAIVDVLEQGSGQDELFDIVRRAVDPIWMAEKTGYLMLNKEWDLDWRSIITATKMVDKKTLSIQDFKTTILLHNEQFGWMVIETAAAGGSAAEEEGRRKIVAFKDELTALGKENLFFRWIELVQYESSRPGGFSPERQVETMAKAKDMFESQGVDFDKFWAKVGGMEGMPGMDQM